MCRWAVRLLAALLGVSCVWALAKGMAQQDPQWLIAAAGLGALSLGLLALPWVAGRRAASRKDEAPHETDVSTDPTSIVSGEPGEYFVDHNGNRVTPVVVRGPDWPSLEGAEYVWIRARPTLDEARRGTTAVLRRPFRLTRPPAERGIALAVRVGGRALVHVQFGGRPPVATSIKDDRAISDFQLSDELAVGLNNLEIAVQQLGADGGGLPPESEPVGVAYRLDLSYD